MFGLIMIWPMEKRHFFLLLLVIFFFGQHTSTCYMTWEQKKLEINYPFFLSTFILSFLSTSNCITNLGAQKLQKKKGAQSSKNRNSPQRPAQLEPQGTSPLAQLLAARL